jgi:CspA family cold shock protein
MRGKVKFYNRQKNFGFITPDDGGEDVFILAHEAEFSGLELKDGDAVEFDREANNRRPGGFVAKNLRTPLPAFVVR